LLDVFCQNRHVLAVSPRSDARILWTGNLATPRRTVLGLLGQIERSGVPPEHIGAVLVELGLPVLALQEPDISITHDQQLDCIALLLQRVHGQSPALQAVETGLEVELTVFGVLGLSMMYAANLREALRLITTYPELSWGHSRIVAAERADALTLSFAMEDSLLEGVAEPERVRRFCITLDLAAAVQMVGLLLDTRERPREVWFPFAAPPDARTIEDALRCPVRFDRAEARITYPRTIWDRPTALANTVVCRLYEKQAAELARRLRTDVPFAEQARRLLWVSSPPPDRSTVARLLGLAPRTLSRRLDAEGTSYGELRQQVRFARAKELLHNPQLQLAEVADRLGFSDPAAFSRAFRKWSGLAPSDWRAGGH
jgi:AraC-like DNA-binding protein